MTKILMADDSAFMRKILIGILAKAGQTEIIEVSDGKAAVEKYKTDKPGLVLLDIVMQSSGIDALKEIKKIDSNAKVIMVTAVGQEVMIKEATEAGAMDYIVKPFKEDQVLAAVKKALA